MKSYHRVAKYCLNICVHVPTTSATMRKCVFSSYVFDYVDYDIPHAMIIKADLCQMTLDGAENYMTTTIHRHIQSRYETKRNLHARE